MSSIPQGTTSPIHPSLPSPPASLSALPSPPTSPRTEATTRIRFKASRRQSSIGYVSSVTGPGSGKSMERIRSASPSILNFPIAEVEGPSGGGAGTITPASASVKAKRRQSSIAYFSPCSPSSWDQRPGLTRTVPGSGPAAISRMEGTEGNAERVSDRGNRESMGSATSAGPGKWTGLTCTNSNQECVYSSESVGGRNREPLTLVEKHADLLHFIAQKERKCLELRDQLTVHERELAELKRKWERIVNRGFASGGGGYDAPSNSALNAGLGGVALDGLREGVRMIAAGLSDLGGVAQESEHDEKGDPVVNPGQQTHTHSQRESGSSVSALTGIGSGRVSISSMSSICGVESSIDQSGEMNTVVTAPTLSRAGSVNISMHKRGSGARSKERSAPPSAYVSPVSVSSSSSTSVDIGLSVASAAGPASVPLVSSPIPGASASQPASSTASTKPGPPAATLTLSSDLAPSLSTLGLSVGGPVPSWVGSMGKKFGQFQKGQTQQRASVLLADVSQTIASALSPRPTATTPAPRPLSPSKSTSTSPSPSSSTSSLRTPPPRQSSRSYSKDMESWLDDDEEQTIHAGRVMVPDSQPALIRSSVTGSGAIGEPEKVSSFDDDDWNW
ncbi:hypothetical protein BU15DRAFT_61475 [Melanogaster broomeanus]|nr:hypothetical protein BU15DRAFT_61475 [Melanogaster broomeanus]